MGNALTRRLGVGEKDLAKLQKASLKLMGVADLLVEAAKTLGKLHVPAAIASSAPWIAFTETIAPALPVVAFVLKLVSKLPDEPTPDGLVYLAATLAYQRSLEQATAAVGAPKKPKELADDMRAALEALAPDEQLAIGTLSFAHALEHPFVREADGFVEVFAQAAGYDKAERRRLVGEIHGRFVVNLKTIVSQGALRAKLAPVLDRLRLGAGELVAFEALVEHADLLRRLFVEAPALGTEPFSLADVYEDLDCGLLSWGDVLARPAARRDGKDPAGRLDPFDERTGGRHPLIATVLEKMGDPDFHDAIVVQGVAGAGKSAFTLRLAVELLHQGLRPVRVRMRDLELDRHAGDAIRRAVRLSDERDPAGTKPAPVADLFSGGAIWRESIAFGRARICPYVLLLDGWDEISVSVTEGFRARLERALEQVRGEFLGSREVPVRVVLTGRPSTALSESSFLREATALLTIRPFSPAALEGFVGKLARATAKPPEPGGRRARFTVDPRRFKPVLARYARDRAKSLLEAGEREGDGDAGRGSMEVLGLPLLAHIAVRLMASTQGDLDALVASPTSLYRSLVDLTCERAGQLGEGALDPSARHRLTGDKLRGLLRRTAAAIAAHGAESISFVELERRLRLEGDELATRAGAAAENVLAALLVSFYFKGGRVDLGCEFVHKSFREYLFAEAIVEALKEWARARPGALAERARYHEDFGEGDPRRALERTLGELLGPHWLSPEVAGHVEGLIAWEIQRAARTKDDAAAHDAASHKGPGRPTAALGMRAWETARDALADLWDAWGDGAHVRPQPERKDRGGFSLAPSLAERLVDWSLPQAASWGDPSLAPPRTTTIDAHLGDGLYRLAALVHAEIALAKGFATAPDGPPFPARLWAGKKPAGDDARRCQSVVVRGDARFVLFAPSGPDPDYFANYVMRVNAAGWRPTGPFPLGARAPLLDLAGASFTVPAPQTPPRPTCLRGANLSGVAASGSSLPFVDLEGALLKEAILDRVDLLRASLVGADLDGASLVRADLAKAALTGAHVATADFTGANLAGAVADPGLPGPGGAA